MLTEARLAKLLRDNPDHCLSLKGEVVKGKLKFEAVITAGKKEVAKATTDSLDDLWLKLGFSFSDGVAQAGKKGGDKKKLPSSQRTALEEGIPGLYHRPHKRKA